MRKLLVTFGLAFMLLGVWAFPAAAHRNTVSGTTECQADGRAKVTWTIKNSEADKSETATLSGALTETTTITAGGTITRTHYVSGTLNTTLTLYVHGRWSNGFTHNDEGSVRLLGICPQPAPTTTTTTTTTTTAPPVVTTTPGVTVPPPRFTG